MIRDELAQDPQQERRLPLNGETTPEEADRLATRLANDVFGTWRSKHHDHRYRQRSGNAFVALRKFILEMVVHGDLSLDVVTAAMEHLGAQASPITAKSLQYAVSVVTERDRKRDPKQAGAFSTMLPEEGFHEFLRRSDIDPVIYGATGQEF